MTMSRHQRFEELISASLSGDLSDGERAQLDAHLDGCAACRQTLASFAEQRRIMSGLRHVAPPRDLGARVRTGVERGAFATTPWWRRPAVVFAGLGGGLAAVAGVLLAIVLLNGTPDDANIGVGSDSPLPSFAAASPSAGPTSPPPSASPVATEPVATPAPTPTAPEASPEPDVYLAYTGPFDNLGLTLRDGTTGATMRELETPLGPPIAAELSPDGRFLAYITELGASGRHELWVTEVNVDSTMRLGESDGGSPFLLHLAWSPDSRYVAYSRSENGTGPDVWIADPSANEVWRFTEGDATYVGSWASPSQLWISTAADQPASHLVEVVPNEPIGMLARDMPLLGVFQPQLSPDGTRVIYWRGTMRLLGNQWAFSEGGAPYLADVRGPLAFVDERLLFSDVTIDRDAFTSARIAWGADSDAYAVWGAEWTGLPQGSGGEYPSTRRVYFGHATDDRELTEGHAIDASDLPEGASVVDVKIPTTNHLLISAREPIGGIMEAPRATLRLVTRNTGRVADQVRVFVGAGDSGWFGPGAYDAVAGQPAP